MVWPESLFKRLWVCSSPILFDPGPGNTYDVQATLDHKDKPTILGISERLAKRSFGPAWQLFIFTKPALTYGFSLSEKEGKTILFKTLWLWIFLLIQLKFILTYASFTEEFCSILAFTPGIPKWYLKRKLPKRAIEIAKYSEY